MSITRFFGMASAAVLVAGTLAAQDAGTPAKPDNTKMNAGDTQKAAPTADHQKMDAGDRHMTAQIRRALIADKSLSTYGHNVKIISRNGKVTLRGPVRSDEEKANDRVEGRRDCWKCR